MTTLEILALNSLPGYGSATVRKIVDWAGKAKVDSAEELLEVVNAYESTLKTPTFKTLDEIKRALMKSGDLLLNFQEHGIKTISFTDKNYPRNLLGTINANGRPDIPLVLYYFGNLGITQRKSIAIIGTSQPTMDALRHSRYFGEVFVRAGYNVVSGLDSGCDVYALEGALKANGEHAIAILDHGIDFLSKDENLEVANEIVSKGGLILSKYPPGEKSNRCTLLSTNRLQAAFADATLVIQSRAKGSTFHAAQAVLKTKKPLLCVDSKFLDEPDKFEGNELLIKEGAVPFYLNQSPLSQVEKAINKMD